MKEIIVYDFDKTLTYKDTLYGFFKAVANRDIFYFPKLFIYISFMVFAKLGLISNTTLKEYGIKAVVYHTEYDIGEGNIYDSTNAWTATK